LLAVVQQAYLYGVLTCKVDKLARSLGLSGIDKSKVSRICKALDEEVQQFRDHPLHSLRRNHQLGIAAREDQVE
jgi:transposase-like protein